MSKLQAEICSFLAEITALPAGCIRQIPSDIFGILPVKPCATAGNHEAGGFVNYAVIVSRFMRSVIFSGDAINRSYFPILVPVGIIGNVLSFLVSISNLDLYLSRLSQKYNYNIEINDNRFLLAAWET